MPPRFGCHVNSGHDIYEENEKEREREWQTQGGTHTGEREKERRKRVVDIFLHIEKS